MGYWVEKGLNIVGGTVSLAHVVSPFAPFVERRVDMRLGRRRRRWCRRLQASVGVDRDTFDVTGRLLRLRKRHGQDAILKVRLGFVFLDALQRNLTFERSVVALADEFRFVAALGLLLAADRKNAVGHLDLDVLFAETGKFGGNRHRLGCLADFEPRPGELALNKWIAKTTKRAEPAKGVVEKAVHLPVKREKRIESLAPGRELLAFRPWNKITNTHDILLDMKLIDAQTIVVRAPRDQA